MLFAAVLGLLTIAAGCKDNASTSPARTTSIPVIVNTSNAFTFVVNAVGYTANESYDLSFTTDSVAYALTIAGYVSGSGSISVLSETGVPLFQDSVLTNKVSAVVLSGRGIPAHCLLSHTSYTGNISFAVAQSQSSH
jgi:hypothetical protein